MKVSESTYLKEKKPVLKKLVDELNACYRYASLLASDCSAMTYSVSATGSRAQEHPLYTSRGFVVRVADERGYGEYSFNSIAEEDIPVILTRIKEELLPAGSGLEGISSIPPVLTDEEETVFSDSTEYQIHPATIGDGAILKRLSGIRAEGLRQDARIIDCDVRCSCQEIHKLFLSNKKDLEQNILWTEASASIMAPRGEEIKYTYEGVSGLAGLEVLDDLHRKIAPLAKTLMELLSSEPMVPGEYECICTPPVTGMIVHEAFGHGVEMDMFVKDRALAKSYVGQYVASPMVTMHDGAASVPQTGTYFFDDEGTMAHDTVIINKGILERGISDRISAEILSTEPTGNGRRESFERKVYTRMTNTYFEPGHDRVEDMIASVKDGMLLDMPFSGMEDPKNWGIQCMVNFAREIKNGKLTGRIFSPIVLTGYVPDLLKSITMMSDEKELSGTGMCGKGYKEWVKVSDGGPWIKARIRLG